MSKTEFSKIKVNGEGGRDHLVIPDDHATPEDNFRRYWWLSELILERQPEVIVKIGDSWDMNSLCTYDVGKKSHTEKKDLKADIDAGHYSEEILFGEIARYNRIRSARKERQYKPLIVKCIGNHEHRLERMLEFEPQWKGFVDMSVFETKQPFEEHIIPFLNFDIIDGVGYSHYFVSGVQGRPVSSAQALINKKGMSCTMGHVHTLDYGVMKKPTGKLIRGVFAGSFHDRDHASFAGPQVDNIWWNGVIYKHNVIDGDYDMEEISVEKLERMYGNNGKDY